MSASARVTVTLEITVPDSWGDDCTVAQIYRQAEESARASIAHALRASQVKAKVIGTPEVTTVITKKRGAA